MAQKKEHEKGIASFIKRESLFFIVSTFCFGTLLAIACNNWFPDFFETPIFDQTKYADLRQPEYEYHYFRIFAVLIVPYLLISIIRILTTGTKTTIRFLSVHRKHLPAVLAASGVFALLLAAPFDDYPYAYYQYLRWIVTAWFVWKLVRNWEIMPPVFKVLFAMVAITFNPIAPIELHRETWAIIDITVATIIPVYWMVTTKIRLQLRILCVFLIIACSLGIGMAATETAHSLQFKRAPSRNMTRTIRTPTYRPIPRRNNYRYK